MITQNIRRGFTSNWSEYYKIYNQNIHNQFDNLNQKSKNEKFGNILLYINQKSKPNLVMSVARIGMTHSDSITIFTEFWTNANLIDRERSFLEIKIIISTCLNLNDYSEIEIDSILLLHNGQLLSNETSIDTIFPMESTIGTIQVIKSIPYLSNGILE